MLTGTLIVNFVLTSLVAGLAGAAAMQLVMWLITREGWAKANMIVAVGSLVLGSRVNAFRLGLILHGIFAFSFAMLYTFALMKLGLSHFPMSVFCGVGFGIIHGMIISLMLVWVISDRHPLEEFQNAGLAVGVSHFAGHLAYGAAVGLIVGLSPL